MRKLLGTLGGGALLVVTLWDIPAIGRFLKWAFGAVSGVDFVYERYRDPSWIGGVVRMAINPPPGTTVLIAAIGLILIYWSTRPREIRMSYPVIGMLICAVGFVGFAFWHLVSQATLATSLSPPDEPISESKRAEIIAPFQAQIEALKKQMAAPPSPSSQIFFSGGPTTEPPEKREYTNRSVRDLLSLYEGKTAFQADKLMEPYKGMWLETEGKIVGLYPDGQGAAVAALRNGGDMIECRFPAESSKALGRYNNGEELKVRGKISTVQNGQQLYLLYCEVAS
ncbi:hypothetical protein OOZ54_20530 [Rhodopseudomonas palustris]|uniref:hypothetical protein n=1 Tax=Rhodopseudomonas palustris TaxID=1076 RepID=UPI0022F0C8DD|nr:hypothetical protein [Rhodopseudomonas palustris]WBU29025.1 hypothetical protein OOZ54_20530 [Rhodopseudomonas palustris]